MSTDLFRRVGEALYGSHYAADLGQALAMSDRNVRRYTCGQLGMSPALRDELAQICEERGVALAAIAAELRTRPRPADTAGQEPTPPLRPGDRVQLRDYAHIADTGHRWGTVLADDPIFGEDTLVLFDGQAEPISITRWRIWPLPASREATAARERRAD